MIKSIKPGNGMEWNLERVDSQGYAQRVWSVVQIGICVLESDIFQYHPTPLL